MPRLSSGDTKNDYDYDYDGDDETFKAHARKQQRQGQIEKEIIRLEEKLQRQCNHSSFSNDMKDVVDSIKEILIALRDEHRLLLGLFDRVIMSIEAKEGGRTQKIPLNSPRMDYQSNDDGGVPPHLESLVRKVEAVVGLDDNEPILEGHITRQKHFHHNNPPLSSSLNDENDGTTLDFSISTYKYLCKYNLLDNPMANQRRRSPLKPVTSTTTFNCPPIITSSNNNQSRPPLPFSSPKTGSIRKSSSHTLNNRILDEELIKSMPKL